MAFGVDTDVYLTDVDWDSFYNWKKKWPSWVGRYFGSGHNSKAGEFLYALTSTSSVCKHVIPLQAYTSTEALSKEQHGYDTGVAHANSTIAHIKTFLTSKELAVNPAEDLVYVYLDVEGTHVLSKAYWAGWADTIYHAEASGLQPFRPCIYARFVKDSSGRYVPGSNVSSTLNTVHEAFTDAAARCYGFWSNEPEPDTGCKSTFVADWTNVFGTFEQSYGTDSYTVPVYAWQYAESGPCSVLVAGYAGGNTLDMDGTDSTGGETYMLSIQETS
jgi:hypothetical protein